VGGFAEFVEKYFETMGDLTKMGLSVWCLDWRGQGGSTRPRTWPNRPRRRDFDRDAADLLAFTAKVLPQNRPRILIAHSMGGAIALLALAEAPGLFRAAVLSAPMFGVHTAPFPGLLARLLAAVGVASGFARSYAPGRGPWTRNLELSPETSLASHDPERCRVLQAWFSVRPDLRVDGPTYGWVQSALDVAARVSDPRLLARIHQPLLIGRPLQESFVDPDATERAVALLPHARMVSFPEARHELFFEHDQTRGRWLAEIDGFLKKTLAPAS
jgi:lysophospholipase